MKEQVPERETMSIDAVFKTLKILGDSEASTVHFHTNIPKKGMNPSLLFELCVKGQNRLGPLDLPYSSVQITHNFELKTNLKSDELCQDILALDTPTTATASLYGMHLRF